MSLEEFSEITLPVPWGHIAGRWYGDQLKKPLVALHGWLDNCGSFARLAPLLTPYTSLLCIDLPGHGYSSHLPVGILYHNLEYVRTLLVLMKAYKWKKISILGHSMGGVVGFMFASLYPDRVDMLIGLDIIKNRLMTPEVERIVIQQVLENVIKVNERTQQQSPMNEPPSYTYEECERLLYEGSEYSVELKNCKYLLERNIAKSLKYPDKYYFSRDSRIKYMNVFNPDDGLADSMVKRICKVELPYLVIRGGASTNISSHTINEIVPIFEKNNKNFEIHNLEHATHHLHLNNPEEVAELIIDFWKRKGWPMAPESLSGSNL